MSDWQEVLIPAADRLYRELAAEGFTAQRIKHLSNALHRRALDGLDGELLAAWRDWRMMTNIEAATELAIAIEDVEAILAGTLHAGPEHHRRIGRALARCRRELKNEGVSRR